MNVESGKNILQPFGVNDGSWEWFGIKLIIIYHPDANLTCFH